jgi:hypothetical protein
VELPLGIYEEITGLDAFPPPVDETDDERRKHRRIPFGCRVTIFPQRKSGDNTPGVAMVRDMSVGGLSILNPEPLKPPTPFVIEFRGHQDRPVKIRCIAVHCEPGGFGGTEFVVGATFDQLLTAVLPPEELHKEQPPPEPLISLVADDAQAADAVEPVTEDLIEEALRDPAAEAAVPPPAATPPAEPPPVFRVIPIAEEPQKAAAVAMELDPPSPDIRWKNHEVLARVKELLLQQEQSFQRQRQELKEQRERFEKEIESMRSELEDTKKKLAELRAKSDADDSAIADLAAFLQQRVGGDSPAQTNEAARTNEAA